MHFTEGESREVEMHQVKKTNKPSCPLGWFFWWPIHGPGRGAAVSRERSDHGSSLPVLSFSDLAKSPVKFLQLLPQIPTASQLSVLSVVFC